MSRDFFRTRRVPIVLTLVASLAGCGSSEQAAQVDELAIQQMLESYLPRLAEAYAREDASVLEGVVAEREIAAIQKRLGDLEAEGRRLAPTFHSVTVEDVTVWSHANAYVTTNEIWDLKLYAWGTDHLLSEQVQQRSTVKYQLKREGDEWVVLYRELQE